jgi:hypothetical protein
VPDVSAQRLNARSLRRIARDTGLPVVRGWAHGGYVLAFAYSDDGWETHHHGWYDKKTGNWGLDDQDAHYSSCYSKEW